MHMKRVTSPKFWKAGRKKHVWIISPVPGPHPKRFSFPLGVIVRDYLGLAQNRKEAKAALNSGNVLVDGVVRRELKFPVGLMDVITIVPLKKHYRVIPYEKGLRIIEIPEKEAKIKVLRVVRKQVIENGKLQITTHDGRNFLNVKADVGDSLVISLPDGKIKSILKLEPGALALVIKGRRAGRMGKVISVGRNVRMEGVKEVFEAPKEYVMVIGKGKPVVKMYEDEGTGD